MQNYPISVLTEGLRLSKTGVLRRKNLEQKTQQQQKKKTTKLQQKIKLHRLRDQ